MTYRLFGRPFSGSLAVEWLLEELGLDYERVQVTGYRDKIEPASFANINPIGQVPALELPDGTVMTESGAIMLYLGDLKPGAGLAPGLSDPAHPTYLRWMTFLAATVYPTMMHIYHPENWTDDEGQFKAIQSHAASILPAQWSMVETALQETGYLAGDRLSAADIYCLMFALWMEESLPPFFNDHPSIARSAVKLKARPAIADILRRHETNTWSD